MSPDQKLREHMRAITAAPSYTSFEITAIFMRELVIELRSPGSEARAKSPADADMAAMMVEGMADWLDWWAKP